ncbi:hypothetical protein I4U23_004666 [Adineta vaga]|nr:hypothetical protein I4U23_004666 [Adineta vaga]
MVLIYFHGHNSRFNALRFKYFRQYHLDLRSYLSTIYSNDYTDRIILLHPSSYD